MRLISAKIKNFKSLEDVELDFRDLTIIVGANATGKSNCLKALEFLNRILFDVILEDVASEKRVAVLKVIRALTSLGLKEAKDLVDNAPSPVKQGIAKADAEKVKAELEAAGAKVEVK